MVSNMMLSDVPNEADTTSNGLSAAIFCDSNGLRPKFKGTGGTEVLDGRHGIVLSLR